jgi:hypothetical protein
MHRKRNDRVSLAGTLHSIGDVELDDQEFGSAARLYGESLSLELEVGKRQRIITYCFAGFAAVEAARGEVQRAGRLWGIVERQEGERGFKLNHRERVRYERRIETLAGDTTFHEAASAGRGFSLEQAIDYALLHDRDPRPSSAQSLPQSSGEAVLPP